MISSGTVGAILLALAGCHLLSGSRIVHIDGPISVAAAFTPGEALSLAERAGLQGSTPHAALAAALSPELECAMMRPCPGLEDVGDDRLGRDHPGCRAGGNDRRASARQLGATTLLVDKQSFPRRKVCGACLNASALEVLRSVGLDAHLARSGRNQSGLALELQVRRPFSPAGYARRDCPLS